MTKEEPERIKQGYQPSPSKNAGVIPPNTGSHVRMEKRIAELEKENAELKEKLEESEKLRDFWKESSFDWRHKFFEKGSTKRLVKKSKQLTKAKEIIEAMLIYQEGFSHMGELKQEAEQFLKEE